MENTTRARWLKIFLSLQVLQIFFDTLNDDVRVRIILLLTVFISASITYYFAYKKRGTKWLFCLLLLIPFNEIYSFSELRTKITPFSASAFLVHFAFIMFFWGASYRLWRFNKEEKKSLSHDYTPTN